MAGSFRDALDLPADVLEHVPRSFEVVGHVAVIRLGDAALPHRQAVGRALLDNVPPARTVVLDRGVAGRLRMRRVELIAGEPTLITEHKENGCRFRLNLATCYFSPRLAGERQRVADHVSVDERVVDLFGGVAPYGVQAARQGARVLSVELNPVAARYARANARLNKVGSELDVVTADAMGLAPTLPARFDRVIANLPHDGEAHVGLAARLLEPGGTAHVGVMLARDAADEAAAQLASAHGVHLERLVHVRNYNPAVGHYCLDLERIA